MPKGGGIRLNYPTMHGFANPARFLRLARLLTAPLLIAGAVLSLVVLGWGLIGAPRLHLYASAGSLRQMAWHLHGAFDLDYLLDPELGERLNLAIHPVEPDQTFAVGPYRAL